MYLEKLEAQGFKSFANKNILVFPGMLDKSRRGLTAVVGPNGSGKSNVADAVRWALGEQSMKALRGKKSEDIIFSGSDKKGKLGMAEVSLHLNNEDKQAPIDYSQIVITRRLYRNGDSEYMLNNNRVRLADIQMLLAKAKFGQKTYSVIGQGMVEGFLNTSLSERKEFFDEATGVKQFQIKRDDSLNKLRSSYENLVQAKMLLSEIEPRLKSLTRQVNRLKKRDEIEKELRREQKKYYSFLWHDIYKLFNEYNKKYLDLEKIKISQEKKLDLLNRDLEKIEAGNKESSGYVGLQAELAEAQAEKDVINMKLARFEAHLEVELEANGKFDLSFLIGKKEEIEKEREKFDEEIINLEKSIGYSREKSDELENEKNRIEKKIDKLNLKLSDLSKIEGQSEQKVIAKIKDIIVQIKKARLEDDFGRIKQALAEIEARLEKTLSDHESVANKEGGNKDAELQEIQVDLNKAIAAKEEIVSKINDNNLRITARTERVKLLKERVSTMATELADMDVKIKKNSQEIDIAGQTKAKDDLCRKQEGSQKEIRKIKEKIERYSQEEEEKKTKLFSLQREIQASQNELNISNNKLNEIKINSTRYETKLEGLEIEIREDLGALNEVRDNKNPEKIDIETMRAKITQLRRQLELIGGIDPQVENEYNETRERFDFLDGQVNDFTKAIHSLQKIVKELDITIKERFDKEFKVIAVNFEKYFKILFKGGAARIIKVMENINEEEEGELKEESEEGSKEKSIEIPDIKKIKFLQKHNATGLAGIEIHATPPGKKIKSVSMLSGGERALTAIALICAIINSNPSPFVVLDEVDAALDEANSERLASILDELSNRTQFIVITHNRATMRKANILYGVTMGDDGVSKLVSIKLEEAKEVAR